MNSWMQGRKEPVRAYGPPGIKELVGGFARAYAMDQTYRTGHHSEEYMPPRGSKSTAVEFPVPRPGGEVVYSSARGLKVTAFEMDHQPVYPAVGYKFELNGRTVLVSGDGEPTAELTNQHAGVELAVRNAISKPAMFELSAAQNATKNPATERIGKMLWDTLDYHSDPAEAFDDARKHDVKLVVICHLAPPPRNFVQKLMFDAWYRGKTQGWSGKWVIGSDGMHWALPKDVQEISRLA